MLLLQFTDTHLPGTPGTVVRGVDPGQTLARCLANARRRHPGPRAILLTGDLVQDEAGGYATLREHFGGSHVPVHCLPGNHDLVPELRSALAGPPFEHGISARYDGWQVVTLDTSVPGETHGLLSADELGRLRQALDAESGAHVLVCLHHPPVPHGSRWLDALGLHNADELFAVLERYPGVRGLLWGHAHQALDEVRGRWQMMCSPSTCMQFLPGSDDFAADDRPPGYRWLQLRPDGGIDTGIEWVGPGD